MSAQQRDQLRLVVAVLTFRRVAQLSALIPLLTEQLDHVNAEWPGDFETSLLVVDNDPDGSARSPVSDASSIDGRVRYGAELVPGIAAARNRALDESASHDLLVFIDDDETPQERWLVSLVQTYMSFSADVVAGAVISDPDDRMDPFVSAGGFLARAHRTHTVTGTDVGRAATNNLLLKLDTVRRVGVRFDERFGLSGGEDSLFTGRLHQAGARMVWCAEAVVVDHVPPMRMTPSYVVSRAASLSNSTVLVELSLCRSARGRTTLRMKIAARESARMVLGLLRQLRARLTGSLVDRAQGAHAVARARGAFAALAGRQALPYVRTDAH